MVPIQTVMQVKLRATQRNVPQDQKPQITHTRRLSVIAEINPEVHCVPLLLPFKFTLFIVYALLPVDAIYSDKTGISHLPL